MHDPADKTGNSNRNPNCRLGLQGIPYAHTLVKH